MNALDWIVHVSINSTLVLSGRPSAMPHAAATASTTTQLNSYITLSLL